MNYKIKYEDQIKLNFIKQTGQEGLEFIDAEILTKQRSVITYLVKNIGSNLLQGKSIMNVSLPIYIFDERTLLDSYLASKIVILIAFDFLHIFMMLHAILE